MRTLPLVIYYNSTYRVRNAHLTPGYLLQLYL